MEEISDVKSSKDFEIALDGDIVLLVGPEMTNLRVHSLVLSLASKPFAAILGPNWKEGHEILDRNESVEIELPEDDPAAMKLICAIIHLQSNKVPQTLAAADVLAITVTVDKYDCIEALKFVGDTWLRAGNSDPAALMLLTAAAYLFGKS